MKYVVLNTNRSGYSVDQCGTTLTVGELVDTLTQCDENTPVYFKNDNGYTYGHIGFEDIDIEKSDE